MFLTFFSGTGESEYTRGLKKEKIVQEYIIEETYKDLKEARIKVDSLRKEVENLTAILDNPSMIINRLACNDYFYKSRKSEYFLGTKFRMYPWINPKINENLLEVMMNYDGPEAFVTSAHRKAGRNVFSKHPQGLAIDIKPNLEMLRWLDTAEGSNWKNIYDVKVLVEDNRDSRWLRNIRNHKFKNSRCIVNKNATAKHIHIQINKFM